jgi:hypothetical protein
MTTPSPCPKCGGVRAWSGTAEAHTVPVLCVDCGREATACPRCGWEWTGLPRNPRLACRGSCISCQVIELTGRRARNDGVPESFGGRPQRSRLLQSLADAGEADSEARWRSYRTFGDLVAQAGRRAEVVARLEAELRTLDAA